MAETNMIDELMAEAGLKDPATDTQATKSAADGAAEGNDKQAAGVDQSTEPGSDAATNKDGSGEPGRDGDDAPFSRRQWKRMKHDNAYLRRRLAELEAQSVAQQSTAAADTAQRATVERSNFKTEDEYFDALVRQRVAEDRAEQALREREELERIETQNAAVTAWSEKLRACFPTKEAQEDYADAMDEAFDGKPGDAFDQNVSAYLFQHPKGPMILRYLAEHPTTCERLRGAHPFDQSEIMRKIVAYVDRPAAAAPANAGTTTARKPVAPVGSVRTGSANSSTRARTAEELFLEKIG